MGITPLSTDTYIDKITLPSNDEYPIVDMVARQAIDTMSSYTNFLGVTTTDLTDGVTSPVITIRNESVTAAKGSIVIYPTSSTTAGRMAREFIYDGDQWQLFGDISANNLGNLAYKNSATGSVTAYGEITTSTTKTLTSKGKFQPTGDITFTTAAQTITLGTSITVPTGAATANFWIYAPAGTVTSAVTRTISTTNVVTSISGNTLISSITASIPTTATPTNGVPVATVNEHKLLLHYMVPSTQNAINTTTTAKVITGVSVTATKNTFTGTEIYVPHQSVVVPTAATFTGTTATVTVTGTVIDTLTFTGTASVVSVS